MPSKENGNIQRWHLTEQRLDGIVHRQARRTNRGLQGDFEAEESSWLLDGLGGRAPALHFLAHSERLYVGVSLPRAFSISAEFFTS